MTSKWMVWLRTVNYQWSVSHKHFRSKMSKAGKNKYPLVIWWMARIMCKKKVYFNLKATQQIPGISLILNLWVSEMFLSMLIWQTITWVCNNEPSVKYYDESRVLEGLCYGRKTIHRRTKTFCLKYNEKCCGKKGFDTFLFFKHLHSELEDTDLKKSVWIWTF